MTRNESDRFGKVRIELVNPGQPDAYKRLHPPNRLRNKVSPGGPGLEAMVVKAEAALAEMGGEFEDHLRHTLAVMWRNCERLSDNLATASRAIQDLARDAHDIRGQAATFGYPLIGDVASSLFNYIEGGDGIAERPKIVAAHLDAMTSLAEQKRQGDCGADGRKLLDDLTVGIARASRRRFDRATS